MAISVETGRGKIFCLCFSENFTEDDIFLPPPSFLVFPVTLLNITLSVYRNVVYHLTQETITCLSFDAGH